MPDDYGSRYSSAYLFPLSLYSNRLSSGTLYGEIGPDDTSDEDWFQVKLLKGATYQFTLTGGTTVYDLNDAVLYFYNTNGTSSIGYNSFEYEVSGGYGTTTASMITSAIPATGNYYLRAKLDSYATSNDVGRYSLKVEQLTEGLTSYITKSTQETMSDDYGSRYSSAYRFPLSTNSYGLNQGSLSGVIGPDDNSDEDWFQVKLLKGASYQFTLTGGTSVYDLNDATLYFYNTNGTSSIDYDSFEYDVSGAYGTTYATIDTSAISATGDYYLRVKLDSYATSIDVGSYTLEVEQLTKGFAESSSTPSSTRPTNSSPATSSSTTPYTGSSTPASSGSTNTNTNVNQTVNNYYGDYTDQSGNSGVINNQQGNSGTINNNQTNNNYSVSVSQILTYNDYSIDYREIGTKASDQLTGSDANDYLSGRSGNDYLTGEAGCDEIIGGTGDDVIIGGESSDIINAGASRKEADKIYIENYGEDTDADIIKSLGVNDQIYVDAEDYYVESIDGGVGIFDQDDMLLAVYTGKRLTAGQLELTINIWE